MNIVPFFRNKKNWKKIFGERKSQDPRYGGEIMGANSGRNGKG